MNESSTPLRASMRRFAQTWRGLLFGFVPEPPKPGTAAWIQNLNDDVAQAQRNVKDMKYVLVRRGSRIRQAREGDARWSEEFAMAYIEAHAGLEPEARFRLQRALDQQVLPSSAGSIIAPAIGRAAARNDRRQLDQATALADDLGRQPLAMALLMETSRFEQRRGDEEAEQNVLREGLRRLGWGVEHDPYRAHEKSRTGLEQWEHRAMLWFGERSLAGLAKVGAFDEADAMMAELRVCAAGTKETPAEETRAWNIFLLDQQGMLAYRRGEPAKAARAWSELLAAPETTKKSPSSRGTLQLNIGFAHLRRGAFDEAEADAKAVLDEHKEASVVTRAQSLLGEAALAQGALSAAERHAKLALVADSAVARSSARRVLAELAIERNDWASAVALAQESVEEAHGALGEDLSLADRLLTLARAATPLDTDLARSTLQRVQALALPTAHPSRREAAVALEKLGS